LHGWYRNQRLAAIHALGRFIGERSPEHVQCAAKSETSLSRGVRRTPSRTWRKKKSMPSWKSRTEAQAGAQRLCALALPLQLRCQGQRGSPCGDRRSGVEPRRNRISETPRKREEGPFLPRFTRPLLQQIRTTYNQPVCNSQIRTQYTILEHSVPSRIALASELFSAAFLVLPFRLELIPDSHRRRVRGQSHRLAVASV